MRDAGLSLIELVTILAITAVLTGTAAFGFRDLNEQWLLGSAIRQVVLDLRLTRVRAISQARPHRLRFEPAATVYDREARDDDGQYATLGVARQLPAGVSIVDCSGRGSAIGFRARGNASPFGTITLIGAGGKERQIIVDMAGRARVAPRAAQ